MVSEKMDFYAKEVTDAINNACETLQVPQEELAIEVVDTGSMGVFGLIRKRAHIRASVKNSEQLTEVDLPQSRVEHTTQKVVEVKKSEGEKKDLSTSGKVSKKTKAIIGKKAKKEKGEEEEQKEAALSVVEAVVISAESMEIVRKQLEDLLRLMGFPSEISTTLVDGTIRCKVGDEHEEALTAQDGKIVDSLQYILRKLAARKVEEKIRLSIDVGEFREKRKVELVARAKELAEMVKADGKTQAIPPLNPSERRVVHVALQEDKSIRSRSVGDGLFKKILIYKPGKGKKPGSNKRGGRGRRGKPTKKNRENGES